MADLLARDYERMLDLTLALLDSQDPDPLWPLVAVELGDRLDATDVFNFNAADLMTGRGHADVWAAGHQRRVQQHEPVYWAMRYHPLARYYVATDDSAPRTVSDILDERSWLNSEICWILRGDSKTTRHLAVPLLDIGGINRFLGIARPGTDFTEHERAYIQRLQPLLTRIDTHMGQLRRWRESAAASASSSDPAERARAYGLTPRELTVLTLLADGLTAGAMAHRLGISLRTVHRHLGNLYMKLGCADRLAAVLRAQALQLLGPPHPDGEIM
jgi:DNA-binding CsgD family transcriptional regulator